MYKFLKEVEDNPDDYRNTRVIFWHTGGSLGAYDKTDALATYLEKYSSVNRMDVYSRKL